MILSPATTPLPPLHFPYWLMGHYEKSNPGTLILARGALPVPVKSRKVLKYLNNQMPQICNFLIKFPVYTQEGIVGLNIVH